MASYSSQSIKEERIPDPEERMREYKRTGDVTLRNELVMHYLQYVNTAIWGMRSILLSNIPYDDFFDQGVLALMDCIETYDESRGATFNTYSYLGIRRALLKYLRKQNWLPNRLWDARKRINQGRTQLEQTLAREPSGKELAEYLELSEAELGRYLMEISVVDTISLESLIESEYNHHMQLLTGSTESEVLGGMIRSELQGTLAACIEELKPKQKQVITLYYYHNLNLREIGEVLELTPQRCSQIRKKALEKLAEGMKRHGCQWQE